MALVNVLPTSFDVMGATTCEASSLSAVVVVSGPSSFGIAADDLTPFEREKNSFRQLLRTGQLAAYQGQFVAIHQGRFAGANPSQNALVRNFFRDHGKGASVYIGFVGPRRVVRVRPLAIRKTS
jgi:hypothetical protein